MSTTVTSTKSRWAYVHIRLPVTGPASTAFTSQTLVHSIQRTLLESFGEMRAKLGIEVLWMGNSSDGQVDESDRSMRTDETAASAAVLRVDKHDKDILLAALAISGLQVVQQTEFLPAFII